MPSEIRLDLETLENLVKRRDASFRLRIAFEDCLREGTCEMPASMTQYKIRELLDEYDTLDKRIEELKDSIEKRFMM